MCIRDRSFSLLNIAVGGGGRDRDRKRETERDSDRDRETERERQTEMEREMIYSFRPLLLMKKCRWMTYHLTVHTNKVATMYLTRY